MQKSEINILSISVIVIIILTTITTLLYRPVIIKERKYESVGNNIYYTNDLLVEKARDKEQIIDCYKVISDYMKENNEHHFYVVNFNYGYMSDEEQITFNVHQMQGNAIILETSYFFVVKNNNVVNSFTLDNDLTFFDKSEAATTPTLTVSQIKRTAAKAVKKASVTQSLILPFSRGEAYLEYDKNNNLYYKVVFKLGTYVKIDAHTGNVIDTYFDNGVVYNK